jgi:hypothetical protein
VFAHSRFVENPPIGSWEMNTSFLRWLRHTYKLDLRPSLAGVHDTFHVSQLKKCLKEPMDVVMPDVTPLEADFTYPKHPIKILDQKDHVTMCKMIKLFKIQWSNHTEEEVMWESNDLLHLHHSDFELP